MEHRRARKQDRFIEEEKGEDLDYEANQRDIAIEELKEKVRMFDEISAKNDKNSQILSRLFDNGIIDGEGELIRPEGD